jgi:hypothetical protein
MQYFTAENVAIVFGVLFGISEALAMIPALKTNSVFQMIASVFKALAKK